MKRLMHIISLGLLIAGGQAHADDQVMGWQTFKVSDTQKNRPIKGLIWYPANDEVLSQSFLSFSSVRNGAIVCGQP